MTLELRALDLYCGLGGWSDGLAMEGFDVLGVEVNPKIAGLYNHPCIIADVTTLDGRLLRGLDLIVGSPPCRDFSSLANAGRTRWKRPPDPYGEGLRLVLAFLRIVREAEPTYWLMENVPGLTRYLDIPPRTTTYLGATMRRCLWGNYPAFLVPRDMRKPRMEGMHNWDGMASFKRARIPLPTARALGRSVRDALELA